ncbi:unnamed protein product [Closterium sp. NIES-64]|nr:unnamed protein product [Closterium sp. NIES-64]
MPREPREVSHVDDFRRLAAENDSEDVAYSRPDDSGDVACDASTATSDVEAGDVRVRTVDYNARRETDYVIVVHGTFDAPPADGSRTWYQPPAPGEQNFCAKMGALLARGPIGAGSVWRKIPRATDSQEAASRGGASQRGSQSQGAAALQEGGSWKRVMDGDVPYPFFWDGSNTHEGRLKAAEKLARLVDRIASRDPCTSSLHCPAPLQPPPLPSPLSLSSSTQLARLVDLIASRDPSARIHVIAHSHGGNVLLKATELCMKRLPTQSLSTLHPAVQQGWCSSVQLVHEEAAHTVPLPAAPGHGAGLAYMKRLPTLSLSTLHPAIRKRFWAAYRRGFDMVKGWRQVDRPSGWRRFFPSLVAMRREVRNGEVRNGEVRNGEVRNGEVRNREVRNGEVRNGKVRNGEVRNGEVRNGEVRNGEVRNGEMRNGEVRNGEVRNGEVRNGEVRNGEVRLECMTGGKLSHGTKEQYPWGRYRWLDSLLGLPTKRQRLFLSHRLATSPLSNALGCLVFLGTPFYVKKWERNGVRWLVVMTLGSVVLMLVVMWGYVMLIGYILRSIIGHENMAETRIPLRHAIPCLGPHLLNLPPLSSSLSLLLPSHPIRFAFPYVTPFLASALILVFATISISIELSRSTAFYSGNIYHSPDFDWSHAMSALVVHAGKLDEVRLDGVRLDAVRLDGVRLDAVRLDGASMALSSEPIARAYVFPHLADMLKLPFWKPLPQFPPHDAVPLDWLLYIASFGRILLWNIIFILPALILSLLSHIVAPLVIGAVRNVIVVISFGLAQNELSFAHVFMDEILDLGLSSQHVEHWNVQKLLALAKTRSLQGELMAGYEDDTCDMGEAVFEEGLLGEGVLAKGEPGGKEGRMKGSSSEKPRESEVEGKTRGQEQLLYEYLWDDKELDEAAAKCLTYQCLEPEINKMWKNPRLTPQQFVRQIKQLCVMIEDRFSELTGKLDLNHGAYFRDPRILGVVAHFLEFRELPEWSREIDADVMRAERMVHSG